MSCGNIPEGQGTAEEEQVAMPRRKQVRRVDKNTCQRCKISKSMYIVRNVTFCKPCFETAVFGRFVKLLHPPLQTPQSGSSSSRNAVSHAIRPPRQAGDVLIALSSGAGSTAMLDLLLSRSYVGRGDGAVTDKTKGEKEPIWGKGWVVYVEFAGVLDGVEDRLEDVKGWVERLDKGLGWIGVRAEDVFDGELKNRLRDIAGLASQDSGQEVEDTIAIDLKDADLPLFSTPLSSASSTTPLDHLRKLIASLPPPSRPALLSNILSSLLTLISQTIPNISHLLRGETSTRQAQRLISGTASGRGWSLPLELSAARKDDDGLVRLKPMKDLSVKEAAVYCNLKGFNGFTRNDRRWDAAGPAGKRDARGKGGVTSLEMLTEQFIAGLSVTHPSTVSTINRTGDKLVFPGEASNSPTCPVCQLPVDPSALEWKSRSALTSLPTKTNPVASPSAGENTTPLAPLLCYACLTTFTPPTVNARTASTQNEPVPLPLWIGENVARQQGNVVERATMKDQIKDFLIQDA
ncbi:hypothetical protein CI109_102599 [Kwoniella shandongensis]|uniref:Cytoplasmic tRNA 2-thiolation protein 2 n=1 Tax=Kwoniella shandongensis TaxID=1734106 RepID=A0A5M6BVW5_9TREE|nr:uncharacterized protein CI109_005180 [Kwoniella shandongensis]KAA5526411.1 hypothetical protein CI109_005180 [Kwoniella shandongensis]